MTSAHSSTLSLLRTLLLATLALGLVGTGAELLLLEHFEDPWQLVPLVLLGLGIVIVLWHVFHRGRTSLRALQGLMLLFLIAGAVGVFLHYRGNVEFELERTPGAAGWALFKASMMGATPALAPGAMVQLALIGLAYAFRHPALAGTTDTTDS